MNDKQKIIDVWMQHPTLEFINHPNVFIDTSAYTANRFPSELVEYINTNGRKKVMFGTNYPMITAEKCLTELDKYLPDKEVKSLFLYKNAQKVFNIS